MKSPERTLNVTFWSQLAAISFHHVGLKFLAGGRAALMMRPGPRETMFGV
jgi:hypothetical protein